MLYLNQKDYPDVPYQHNLKHGGAPAGHANIASAGCGICCMCMIVDQLTCRDLSLTDCRDLAEDVQANLSGGCDLQILGPEVARRYELTCSFSDDIADVRACLQSGGRAVANSGGDQEGHIGLLSHGGHYVVLTAVENDRYCCLDPSWTKEKYQEEGRKGKVTEHWPFVYLRESDLQKDCASRHPSYYLFARKK